jgi:hypothetical protein
MKIFGIGLSRTGTFSLSRALEILGYRSKHFPRIEREILNGDYHLPILDEYDALTDTPVVPIFPQLDTAYPGSKFILTIRDLESWLDACERFFTWQDQAVIGSSFEDVVRFHRLYVYGRRTFHRDRWAYVYERHHANVDWYFRERPNDLLKFDIRSGAGWEVLCPFLRRPAPSDAFPHVNAFSSFSGGAQRRRRQDEPDDAHA